MRLPQDPARHMSPLLLAAVIVLFTACEDDRSQVGLDVATLPFLTAREEMRIGSLDNPYYGFSRLGDVAVDHEGLVYVAETLDHKIRVYDPDGALVRTIGGQGEGPGEFRSLTRMGLIGDTIWVIDRSLRRVTLFDRDGTAVETVSSQGFLVEPLPPGVGVFIHPGPLRSDGHLDGHVRVYWDIDIEPKVDSFAVPHVVYNLDGRIVDTLGWHLRRFRRAEVIDIRGNRAPVPFPEEGPFTVVVADDLVVVRWSADPRHPTITVTRKSLSHDTIFHTELGYRPRPFTSEHRDSMADEAAARLEGPFQMDRDVIASALREAMNLPVFQPPVSSVRAAQDETLWLRRERDPRAPDLWTLIAADGAPIGQVELPADLTIRWSAGNKVWASRPEDLDVPWLIRYRLMETEG